MFCLPRELRVIGTQLCVRACVYYDTPQWLAIRVQTSANVRADTTQDLDDQNKNRLRVCVCARQDSDGGPGDQNVQRAV